jgi:response regulator NasT
MARLVAFRDLIQIKFEAYRAARCTSMARHKKTNHSTTMNRVRVFFTEGEAALRASWASTLSVAGLTPIDTPRIEEIDVRHPHVGLIDLPGAGGASCVAEVLAWGRRLAEADMAWVAVLAETDVALMRQAIEAGAYACVVKPLDIAGLAPSLCAFAARAAEVRGLRDRQRALVHALGERRTVSTAVGVLCERHRLSPELAFDRLRRMARDQRSSVSAMAARLVAAFAGTRNDDPVTEG